MSNGFLSIRRTSLYAFIAYILFFLANYAYYAVFATDYLNYWINNNYNDYFYFPLNLDQGKSYMHHLNGMTDGKFIPLSSATGIAYIYFFFSYFFIEITADNVALISFIFNNIFVIISYLYFVKIGVEVLRLPLRYRWLFFMNPSLIYFSQMIQKEMLSLAAVLALTYYIAKTKKFKSILVTGMATIQRIHFLVLTPMAIFLTNAFGGFWKKVFILYVMTSLGAAYLVNSSNFVNFTGASADGYSQLILKINRGYYIGNLLFNPIKFVQYLYDLFASFNCITNNLQIDLYRAHNIPYLIFLIFNWKKLRCIVLNYRAILRGPSRTILSVIIAYVFMILVAPIVHSRYLFPISYLLILLVLYSRRWFKSKHGIRLSD